MPDYLAYRKSLSDELIATKDRVEYFVQQWPEVGRYKEIILQDVLVRHLPKTVSVGTGFIVGKRDLPGKQIDIIIYNNAIPPLFQLRDFVVVTRESVLGIIEVKSKISKLNGDNGLCHAIEKAHENGRLVGRHIFSGIFSYEADWKHSWQEQMNAALLDHHGYTNHICLGKDLFVRHWKAGQPVGHDNSPPQCPHYTFYKINDLAFGYFISNLVELIQEQLGEPIPETFNRYLYPIEETKEFYRIYDLRIDNS